MIEDIRLAATLVIYFECINSLVFTQESIWGHTFKKMQSIRQVITPADGLFRHSNESINNLLQGGECLTETH
jgi:hypothetical protein